MVVVAEGAEDGLIDEERASMREQLGIKADAYDGSGNLQNVDLAKFMVSDLAKYSKEKHGTTLTVKYLNPTYAIRTTLANGADNDLCHKLAHTAVHSIQAGYTDFSVGLVRNYPVLIPLWLLIAQSSRKLKRRDPEWQRVVGSTGQPNFLDKENTLKYLAREKEMDISRKEKYLQIKLQSLNHEDDGGKCHVPHSTVVGAAGTHNY